jgi:ribosomal protein L23
VKGKARRTRRGKTGRTTDWKKAVVTLKPDWSLKGLLGQAFETG